MRQFPIPTPIVPVDSAAETRLLVRCFSRKCLKTSVVKRVCKSRDNCLDGARLLEQCHQGVGDSCVTRRKIKVNFKTHNETYRNFVVKPKADISALH